MRNGSGREGKTEKKRWGAGGVEELGGPGEGSRPVQGAVGNGPPFSIAPAGSTGFGSESGGATGRPRCRSWIQGHPARSFFGLDAAVLVDHGFCAPRVVREGLSLPR